MFSLKSIEKALVLLCFRSKRLKNHWFYCKNAKKWKKPLVLLWIILKNSKKHCKTCVFLKKKGRKTNSVNGFGVRDKHACSWRDYEEPLQPSCLGKNRLFFHRKVFADDKTRYKNRLWWESSMNFKTKARKWKKRLFFQRKIFADDKTRCKNRLWWESSMNLNLTTDLGPGVHILVPGKAMRNPYRQAV